MWVMSDKSSFAFFFEASLSLLLETRTLKSTPLVQNTIEESFPPLLSNLIYSFYTMRYANNGYI